VISRGEIVNITMYGSTTVVSSRYNYEKVFIRMRAAMKKIADTVTVSIGAS
jgi:hypothetical protein